MNRDTLLHDPFLLKQLNPLFFETLNGYWKSLTEAQVLEEEKDQIQEALYNLVRFLFRDLFKDLYCKHPPRTKGLVFLLSAIHSDGIGDYIATLKCARLMKQQHPELDVHIAYTHKQRLPKIDPDFYLLRRENIHDFQEGEDLSTHILGNVLEGKPLPSFSDKLEKLQAEKNEIESEYKVLITDHPHAAAAIKDLAEEVNKPLKQFLYFEKKKREALSLYAQMKNSLALIHVALALNTFDNPALSHKSLYFAETGNFQGIGNYLQKNWFSLGLGPFEEGLFLQKEPEEKSWIHTELTQLLWRSSQPKAAQINEYFKSNSLHVGYLPRIPEQKNIFIDLICKRHLNDDRNIDIILPEKENVDMHFYNREWMVENGISKIVIATGQSHLFEQTLYEIDLPVKKTLRLICILPLASSDFIKLLDLCGEIVGCTGDGSLSDCILAGKIPFYEIRRHKLGTLEAFKHLARKLTLPDLLDYFELLEQIMDWPAESFIKKLEQVLTEGTFKLQWREMVEFIKKYYTFENSFKGHVNRQLFISLLPEIKEKEELLIQKYFEGSITAEQAFNAMEQILKNHAQF